jgi:hypothetical protein
MRLLLLDALAVHRLSRLVAEDTITEPVRDAVVATAYRRAGADTRPELMSWTEWAAEDSDAPKLATLVTCRWCVGTWVAMGVVVLRRLSPRAWEPVAEVLALSSVGTLVAGLETD